MTKDDIMRWAREAGLKPDGNDWGANVYRKAIEDFANLVAAAEREECAKVCEAQKVGYPSYFEIDDHIQQCADTIRARGTT